MSHSAATLDLKTSWPKEQQILFLANLLDGIGSFLFGSGADVDFCVVRVENLGELFAYS